MQLNANYVFPRVFDEFEYSDGRLKLTSKPNIGKYPFKIREIFYKYYPSLLHNSELSEVYSSDDLEADLLKDDDLVFLPTDLIDPDVISTKTFIKPLSFDYNILENYVHRNTNIPHYEALRGLKYITNYKLNDYFKRYVSNLPSTFRNIDIYCELFNPVDVVNRLPLALSEMDEKYLPKYFENVDEHALTNHMKQLSRYFRGTNIDNTLWELIPSDKRLMFGYCYYEVYEKYPSNIYSEEYDDYTYFHMTLNTLRISLPEGAEPFLEQVVKNDKYTGEWVKMDVTSRKYKEAVVDDVKYRLNQKNIKEEFVFCEHHSITRAVIEYIRKYKLYTLDKGGPKDVKYTSSLLYTKGVEVYNDIGVMFDKDNSTIRKLILEHTKPKFIPEIFHYELKPEDYKVDLSNDINILTAFNLYDPVILDYFVPANPISKFTRFIFDDFLRKVRQEDKHIKFGDKIINYAIEYILLSCDFDKFAKTADKSQYHEISIRKCDAFTDYVYCYIEYLINDSVLDIPYYNELIDKYIKGHTAETDNKLAYLGMLYIKRFHEEPPLVLYGSPNTNISGNTNKKMWNKYVNDSTTPKEMTDMFFWKFMIKNNGNKRSEKSTSIYTFFSNSLENKIIFVKSDVVLDSPAVLRVDIPIEFNKLKSYLHEGIETNNICMFTELTANDFNKISGGRGDIDCVVFSDRKNVYCERTPLRNVMKHLLESIEVEYEIEINSEF